MDERQKPIGEPDEPTYEAPELKALGTVTELSRVNEISSPDTPVDD